MKILILSDLHLEHADANIAPGDYDLIILAGDIKSPGRQAVAWAAREAAFVGKPVLLVPGNHEFYGTVMEHELRRMRAAAEGTNVHVLDGDEFSLDGLRILGATLWTDFKAMVLTHYGYESNVVQAGTEAQMFMNDFHNIRVLREPPQSGNRKLRPADTIRIHGRQRQWLRDKLAEPFNGKTIAITHHAPHRNSIAPVFESNWLTPAYVTEMPKTFFDNVDLWVHGHTHAAMDYQVERSGGQDSGACRVICNPRGYPRWDKSFEVKGFEQGRIVEL